MLKAVIFDFDGIIADTEPVHMRAFQLALDEKGISLTRKDYYEKYLAYDDKTLFRTVLEEGEHTHDEILISDLMDRKSDHYEALIKGNIKILPGAGDFIRNVAAKYSLAIGSGALRGEILHILQFAGIDDYFDVIVSAEDVQQCKPAPDVFLEALRRLNTKRSHSETITSSECLVVEDSVSGVRAAISAGMKCLAVTNSCSAQELSGAHLVRDSLNELKLKEIEDLF
ncbi:MAG: HAD family phosphatase [Deltaproteobacteria bacterium]